MQKWNQVNKRLKTIIADGLDISFNHSPLVKRTSRAEYCISFFNVKFNGKNIWQYPKDNAYHNYKFHDKYESYNKWERPWQGGKGKWEHSYASPENIIAGYLDMPKDKLLEFNEPTGLRYILWACDKRIGKNKLSQIQFIKQALPVIKTRVPEYSLEPCLGNSMTLVYSDDMINIFGKSEWKFDCVWCQSYFKTHRFIVADNPSYSLSKHAVDIDFDGHIKYHPGIVSKNVLKITPEIEQRIITALKSPSKNMENKTVWEEIIKLENLYPTTDQEVPEDYQLFTEINNKR